MTDEDTMHMNSLHYSDEMENMYLNFQVENELYGIEIKYVIQIIGMQEITKMPDMTPAMKGYINLRGNVIPVVSMRLRFGKAECDYTDRTCIAVTMIGDNEIGLIVDAIKETITIEPEAISPTPGTGATANSSYILGIARLPNDNTAMLVDVQKLFSESVF